MIERRQVIRTAAVCLQPFAVQTLVGAPLYCAALAWMAVREVEGLGTTSYIQLAFALATLGAWVGSCVGRTAKWPGAFLTPGYRAALGTVAVAVAGLGFGINVSVAQIGGLAPWPLAAFGALILSACLVAGLGRPLLVVYLSLCMAASFALGPALGRDVLAAESLVPAPAWSAVALVPTVGLLAWFASLVRFPQVRRQPRSVAGPRIALPAIRLLRRRITEPSMRRVAVMFGVLATGCALAQRIFDWEWRDGTWLVVLGSICASLGVSGVSASLPRGPLPGTSWRVLLGAAETRAGAGRRMLWGIVGCDVRYFDLLARRVLRSRERNECAHIPSVLEQVPSAHLSKVSQAAILRPSHRRSMLRSKRRTRRPSSGGARSSATAASVGPRTRRCVRQ